MAVLITESTRIIVQGITGKEGAFHTQQMVKYNTKAKVLGGVTPGKGKQKTDDGLPIFNSVKEAVSETNANASIIFVPPPFAADAILEAALAGIKLVICITEGIPVRDMSRVMNVIRHLPTIIVGPNCPGVISPGIGKMGIMPESIHSPGKIGVISRSGTLTYEAVSQLSAVGLGQSTCIGIGGDPIIGLPHLQAVKLLAEDDDTDAIVMIGEIGGTSEEEASDYIKQNVQKPVVGFIAGQTAPKERRMGHAGAIVSGSSGTAESKIQKMKASGIHVCISPADIGKTMKNVL